MQLRPIVGALVCASLCAFAHAQQAPSVTAIAGAVVELEIGQSLDSDESRQGDTFPIALHAPLQVDGVVVLPAGTPGVGEVVYASRATPEARGRLQLDVRYLDADGVRIPLRSLHVALVDTDPTPRPGFSPRSIIRANNFTSNVGVPQGALAQAKLVQDFTAPTSTGTHR